jgi:hypothetical protein
MGTTLENKVKQFKLRAPEDLLNRIALLSEKYDRRSVNQVIVEVLTYYLDFWEQAEQARLKKISEQRVSVADPMALGGASLTKHSVEASKDRTVDTLTTEPLKIPIIGDVRIPENLKANSETTHPKIKSKGSKKS